MIRLQAAEYTPGKILGVDCEARPLGWYGGEWVHKEITAIACKFVDEKEMFCWTLTWQDMKSEAAVKKATIRMLESFRVKYDLAEIVVGHYTRGFDLPTMNSMMLENGLPPLGDKLVHDTKLDMVTRSGISVSQENLGAMLGLDNQKVSMNQSKWRTANRLTPEGVALTIERVTGDVIQNLEMRAEMLRRGALGPPKLWQSTVDHKPHYHA